MLFRSQVNSHTVNADVRMLVVNCDGGDEGGIFEICLRRYCYDTVNLAVGNEIIKLLVYVSFKMAQGEQHNSVICSDLSVKQSDYLYYIVVIIYFGADNTYYILLYS